MTAWKDGAGPGCPLLRYAAVSQDDDAFSHFNTLILKLFSWPAMERDSGGVQNNRDQFIIVGGCKHPIRGFIREDGTWNDGVNGA